LKCKRCGGRGWVFEYELLAEGTLNEMIECWLEPCSKCNDGNKRNIPRPTKEPEFTE